MVELGVKNADEAAYDLAAIRAAPEKNAPARGAILQVGNIN